MKKRFIGVLVVFLLALSIFVSAQNETAVEFMLHQQHYEIVVEFNPENRGGMSWWARGEALTGN